MACSGEASGGEGELVVGLLGLGLEGGGGGLEHEVFEAVDVALFVACLSDGEHVGGFACLLAEEAGCAEGEEVVLPCESDLGLDVACGEFFLGLARGYESAGEFVAVDWGEGCA